MTRLIKVTRCQITFPWTKTPCPNEAEKIYDETPACWECADEKKEQDREREGMRVDSLWTD